MSLLDDLVAIIPAVEPFAGYWAILSIGEITKGKRKADLPPNTYAAMQQLLSSLKPDSDRYYELNRIIRLLEQ